MPADKSVRKLHILTPLPHMTRVIDEPLFRPLFSFPDIAEDALGRRPKLDACRIPLVETLCKYLREPHPMATPMEVNQSLPLRPPSFKRKADLIRGRLPRPSF
jgi:hypothetical protein